jgi:hypothetical protein
MSEVEGNWVGYEHPEDGHKRGPEEHWHTPEPCTSADLFKPKEGAPEPTPEEAEALAEFTYDADTYLAYFVKPPSATEALCFHCGSNLLPDMVDQFLERGGFSWSLVHGEGTCNCCKWPVRVYHDAPSAFSEEKAFTLRNYPLSLLPKSVEIKLPVKPVKPAKPDQNIT